MTVTNDTIPVVSGLYVQGRTLTTTDGTWTSDETLSFAYEWLRCDALGDNCVAITGAHSNQYLLVLADVGSTIRSEVTATENAPPIVGDKFASPSGNDSNAGTFAAPYKTLVKLQTSLAPGQVGSLRASTPGGSAIYGTSSTYHNLTGSGTSGNPITIQAYPGDSITIKGNIDMTGSWQTLKQVHIDGSNPFLVEPSKCGTTALGLTLKGHDNIIEFCEIYQSGLKGSGIISSGDRAIIRNNQIHDIGSCFDYDHGVYLGDGDSCQIYQNWFWNNAHGWGVQLYPSCSNADVHSNVVDNMGSGFVMCDAITGCDVYNNVVTGSVGLPIQGGGTITGAGLSGCGANTGGNTFHDNDCYNNPGGVGSATNIALSGNITSNPLFVNPGAHNYLLQGGSPAAGYGLPTSAPGPDF